MNDNSPDRLFEVFFYGLYMAPEILKTKEVTPKNPRKGVLKNYKLRLGKMATLLRERGQVDHGMVYSLNQKEAYNLYQGSGLSQYRPEAVMVLVGELSLAALTYNLIIPPEIEEENPEYKIKLKATMENLGLPSTQIKVA